MSYVEHKVFKPPEDENAVIWRYMDIAKFVWLLEHEALYFPRADLLGDPHEGAIPEVNRRTRDLQVEEQIRIAEEQRNKLSPAVHEQIEELERLSGRHAFWAPGIDPQRSRRDQRQAVVRLVLESFRARERGALGDLRQRHRDPIDVRSPS
jgi:hypothetical protein